MSAAYRRLYERFAVKGVSAGSTPPPHILPGVRLVTDLDALVKSLEINSFTSTAQGTGVPSFNTVPAGERWLVHAWYIYRATGDRNINAVLFYDGSTNMRLTEFSAASFALATLEHPLPLDRNWSVQVNVTGGTSDSVFVSRLLVEVEQAY